MCTNISEAKFYFNFMHVGILHLLEKIIKLEEFDAKLFVHFISDRKCMEFTIVGRGYVKNEGRKTTVWPFEFLNQTLFSYFSLPGITI